VGAVYVRGQWTVAANFTRPWRLDAGDHSPRQGARPWARGSPSPAVLCDGAPPDCQPTGGRDTI